MPPFRRNAATTVPTLVSLTKLFHAIPKRSAGWTTQLALAAAAAEPIEPEDPPNSPAFWWKLGLSVVFVLSGGVFAGLTLALMGSDDLNLRVLSQSSSDPKERKAANKVLRLLARGRHWVLVVLLLSNVIVNESLPIFLDDVLGGGLYAVIVSTTMIVIFGEIIPQAICVRYGLAIGGACAPMVWFFMIIFSPIAWPVAKLLDYVLGTDEGHTYKKAELKSFLQFHREGEEPLRDDEIGILNGVLSLNDKHAQEIMTPIKDCLTLPADKILDHEAIDQILLSGFSRIPIHEPGQKDNFIGMLLLITYNPEDELPVSKFSLLPLPEAKPEINCFQALDYFQTGRAHLLLISNTPGQKGGAIGIVSLEDLIEEIIGEEIVDETDRYEDNHSKKAAKRSGPAAVMRGIIERRRVINAFSRRPSRSDTHQTTNTTNGAVNTSDGILVQIDNGNLIAEPVGFEGKDHVSLDTSKRIVIGDAHDLLDNGDGIGMGSTDAQGQSGSNDAAGKGPETSEMETIEEAASAAVDAAQDAVESAKGDVDVGQETIKIEPAPGAEVPEETEELEPELKSGSTSASGTSTPLDASAAQSQADSGSQAQGSSGGANGEAKKKKKNKKKNKKVQNPNLGTHSSSPVDVAEVRVRGAILDLERPFGARDEFNGAARGLLDRYHLRIESAGRREEGGSLAGWEWVESSEERYGGYLHRRITRVVELPVSDHAGESGGAGEPGENVRLDDGGRMEMMLEEEDDLAVAPLAGRSGTEAAPLVERVEIQQDVVWSKEEQAAMFCFTAWNEAGAPLPVDRLLQLDLLRPPPVLKPTFQPALQSAATGLALADQLLFDPNSSDPLIVSVQHPVTGQHMLGMHPRTTRQAVQAVLKDELGSIAGRSAAEDTEREQRVIWMEGFMMLVDRVVDLSPQ